MQMPMQDRSENKQLIDWIKLAVFVIATWIVAALTFSFFFGVHWLTPGDFDYGTAMYYHGLLVPVLILLFLLTVRILPVNILNRHIYGVGAMLAVVFVGFGSIFNSHKGLSIISIIQITGMTMTDLLGISLIAALVHFAVKNTREKQEINAAFWLLFSSLVAVVVAAPLGHLAGWCIDLGIFSLPGGGALLKIIGMTPDQFQEGVVSSHSHLIVFATLSGLVALSAIRFGYKFLTSCKRHVSSLGLWMTLISILIATAIYVISALAGWEPPTFFTSGPNGINGVPLDDIVLIFGEVGFIVLIVGLAGASVASAKHILSLKITIRLAVFLNWIFSFIGAAVLGLYIEFNETFYGAGNPPAPGAANDQIFIRAHLLYSFLLLPIIFSMLLAADCTTNQARTTQPWIRVFACTSMFGMVLGLIGEFLWVTTLNNSIFFAGMIAMGAALIAGIVSLWPMNQAGSDCLHISK